MHISQTIRESCIGITLELSNQELIILAEENNKLLKEMAKDDGVITGYFIKVRFKTLTNITTLISRLTDGVDSLDDIRDKLFSKEIDK